jgi:predicted XRE-type DNA-binding protein
MSGTSNWKTIRDRRVGDDPARAERARQAMLAELRLGELRKRRNVSQATVAERLSVSQANVSQLERGDIKLSTLAGYVEALGGKLVLQAAFPDESVVFGGDAPVQAASVGSIVSGAGVRGQEVITRTKARRRKVSRQGRDSHGAR